MTQNTFDAILKKRGGVVHIAMMCIGCRTVIKLGRFPETCPWPVVTGWIDKQKGLLAHNHLCRDELPKLVKTKLADTKGPAEAPLTFFAALTVKAHDLARRCYQVFRTYAARTNNLTHGVSS